MEIFFPVILLMFHTLVVTVVMGFKRYKAVSQRQVSAAYYKLYLGDEPEGLRVFSRHVINLLEAPVLFYLGAIIAFVTGQSGTVLLVLAWTYVGLRLLHTFVHLGSNVVIWRFRVFALSLLALTAFLATIAVGLVGAM